VGIAEDTGGYGLGLRLYKKIIDVHGGEIDVRSRAGSGSRFIITLPDAN
jgi:signal transduction histidine kinase